MRLPEFLNNVRRQTHARAQATSRLVDPRAMIAVIIATSPTTPRAVVLSRVLAGLDGEPAEFHDADLFALDAEAIGLVGARMRLVGGPLHTKGGTMIIAHFVTNEEEREAREVSETWLYEAWANHENVLLGDGNPYEIVDVQHIEEEHARVQVVAPRFARGG